MGANRVPRQIYASLAKKYQREALWYIEYPHKKFWAPFGDQDFRDALQRFFGNGKGGNPSLLYLHIPFCQQMCYFCVCHFHITQKYDRVLDYMKYLHMEINLLREFLEKHGFVPNIRELHLGGGSPTYLREKEFDELMKEIEPFVDMDSLREFAIEIDPRRVDKDRMRFYHEKGINRISFGVQDFDPRVMEAINRIQPPELTADLLTPEIRALFPNGINFDIICGLPKQTLESFAATIRKVIELSPDRVSLTFLAYSPENAPHQKLMLKELPDMYTKKLLFTTALEMLEENGYIRSGYDHFAKATDAVAKAKSERRMAWNSFGFTPGECVDVIALGEHSYSTIGDTYSQNCYEKDQYEKALREGRFPAFRGHILTQDDFIRRDVIHTLRGYFSLDFRRIENKYNIYFPEYFQEELARLKELINDGIVELTPASIVITEVGHQFGNLVCEAFDSYLKR